MIIIDKQVISLPLAQPAPAGLWEDWGMTAAGHRLSQNNPKDVTCTPNQQEWTKNDTPLRQSTFFSNE